MTRPPPKKHKVQAPAAVWKPGDARQVITQANQANVAAQELTITVPGSATTPVAHPLARLPRSAWVKVGADKVTVTGSTELVIYLKNSDAAPQTVTVAIS